MPKIGREVEGRLRGVKTLFVDAAEVLNSPAAVRKAAESNGISHIYISDRTNDLKYYIVADWFPSATLITMDITQVKSGPRPQNITLMLTLPHELFESVKALGADDQVKFHSEAQEVLCVSARHLVPTYAIEFAGDVQL